MKLVLVDNYARETVADVLLCEGKALNEMEATLLANAWNEHFCKSDHSSKFCVAKPDDYKLWRGMEEFV